MKLSRTLKLLSNYYKSNIISPFSNQFNPTRMPLTFCINYKWINKLNFKKSDKMKYLV